MPRKKVSVKAAIYLFVILSSVCIALTWILFDRIPFYGVTVGVIFSISAALVLLELLYTCHLTKEKYNIKLKAIYKKEKVKNIVHYLFAGAATQINAYFLSFIALSVSVALVPVSVKIYNDDISSVSVISQEVAFVIIMAIEALLFVTMLAKGGWVKIISIVNDELNFKNIGFTIIAGALAIPAIVKTATSTEKVDLMFKLVAFGVMLIFTYVHQKWIDMDLNAVPDLKRFRKVYIIAIMLAMYSCCYYQLLYANSAERTVVNEDVTKGYMLDCFNSSLNGFHLKCESFKYIYKNI